jgi:hypothetical protein
LPRTAKWRMRLSLLEMPLLEEELSVVVGGGSCHCNCCLLVLQ